ADFASPNLPPPPTSGPFALAPTGAVLYQPTFGVNWYFNDYTRVMFNYSLPTPEARGLPTLPVHVFGIRAAIWW
ncbi:MAG: OprO/OprP family phosphate-selective porin, partial [Planctomycetia bacterium]|nr:OprO/OprP family phosphate-selective porin [Planctomycetia bacterium]